MMTSVRNVFATCFTAKVHFQSWFSGRSSSSVELQYAVFNDTYFVSVFCVCIRTQTVLFKLQADKRAHHNALERKRRDHIKDSFHSLRDSVPSLQGEKVGGLFLVCLFLNSILGAKFIVPFYYCLALIAGVCVWWSGKMGLGGKKFFCI